MMDTCSFCSQAARLKIGALRLCPACQGQLAVLPPHSAAYLWYVAAVRRSLFPRKDARR